MRVGEVISALALCASGWSDEFDHLLMLKDVCQIEIGEDYIDISFVDANTSDIRIGKDGKICL